MTPTAARLDLCAPAPPTTLVIDLFAGPGGWDTGARIAGYTGGLVGIDNDADACATAVKAGHDRIQADVAALDPEQWARQLAGICGPAPDGADPARWHGLISGALGSPPCHPWAQAGKALGLLDRPAISAHAAAVAAAGHWIDYLRTGWHDDRSPLVLEVLRWVLLLRPRWFAFEQVPAVLPFWQELAEILRAFGYSTAAYLATAEEYGVPQTRRRAFLTGSLDAPVGPPPTTHQRYVPGQPARHTEPDLFGPGVLPWVSMAEALGWHPDGHRPRPRDLRSALPAQVVTEKVRSGERWMVAGGVAGEGRPRHQDEPAPIAAKGTAAWVDHPDAYIRAQRITELAAERDPDGWTHLRPATTVQGDPRIWPPGHKVNADDRARHADADQRYGDRAGSRAIRVSVEEAGILQAFPPDYPWQGTKTSQYRQVGNAVPPLLGAAILQPLLAATGQLAPAEQVA